MNRPTFAMTKQEYKVKAMLLGDGHWYTPQYHLICDDKVHNCYDPDTLELLFGETNKSSDEFRKFIDARSQQFAGYQRR